LCCCLRLPLQEEWSKRFFEYFGCEPFIWHSKQTKQQKSRILRSLLSGEPCVIVGARSAVLLPFQNLKLIICDEEHDSSYKQEEGSLDITLKIWLFIRLNVMMLFAPW
jgi:primosomal protein N' (replication factor Y)